MKKIFTLIAALFAAVAVNAQTTITFDATTDKGNITDYNNAGADGMTKDGITIAISNGCLGLGTEYRTYKNATMTVTSTIGNISSIEFTCTAENDAKYGPGCFTASVGNYGWQDNVGTWGGDAAEVVFTAASNQVRATKIVVTVGGEAPNVEPGESVVNTPETAYTVAKALEMIAAGQAKNTKVYVKGIVSKIDEISIFIDGDEEHKYGNATYYISDDGTETSQLEVFRGYGLNGDKFTSEDQLKVGDQLIVYGELTLYQQKDKDTQEVISETPEIAMGSQIYSTSNTTGIENVTAKAQNGKMFNLAGQEVSKNFKGIVIINGKKYMVK